MPDGLEDVREAREMVQRLPDTYATDVAPDTEYSPGWHEKTPAKDVPAQAGVDAKAPLSSFLGMWFGKPSLFAQHETRIMRLFRLVGQEIAQLRGAFAKTGAYRDLDSATGATLDRIGRNVRQFRGALSDETYRVLIKGKIARNLSRGDVNSVKRVLAVTLGVEPSDIVVEPLWAAAIPEPAAVVITTSLDALANAGLSPKQFAQISQLVVAAGVRVQSLFEGTFQFAAGDQPEMDPDTGFADEDQTFGGTLGAWFDPGEAPLLPLED